MEPGYPIACSDDVSSMEVDDSNYTYQTAREVPGSASNPNLTSQRLETDAEVMPGQASGAARGSSITLTGQQTAAPAQRDKITIEGEGCKIVAEGLGAALKPGGVFQLGSHNHMTIHKTEGGGDGAGYKFKKNKFKLTESTAEPLYKHLDMVSSKLAGDWQRIGRYMGLDESTLDQLRQDYHVEGQHEINYRMLLKWKQSGRTFTLAGLAQVLAEAGRGDIADELRNG